MWPTPLLCCALPCWGAIPARAPELVLSPASARFGCFAISELNSGVVFHSVSGKMIIGGELGLPNRLPKLERSEA